ncbi:MAG: tyrosine-type recombinase/integrase [Eubacterium sp.]
MANAGKNNTGVYQLKNGYWGFRYGILIDGKKVYKKMSKDEFGNPYKTKKQASEARLLNIARVKAENVNQSFSKMKKERKRVEEIYQEYCEKGRVDKAYSTIKKQDSLWKNHIGPKFGKRYINDISVAEINDYLAELYYVENRSYKYTESFLKMFYLIFGQAYSRDYLDIEIYDKLCKNKSSKIHMPKMKIDEETDIVVFTAKEMKILDSYFCDTNAETTYMLGKYCGLRINECYGLKWDNIDFENGYINIDRQMQYQDGIIKLVSLKTRNAKRKIYMCEKLKDYLQKLSTENEKNQIVYAEQREQNQTFIRDLNGEMISSLELVNSLPNGKIQTVNSLKYHTRTLQEKYNITFKYHYLRHTYGTTLANLNTPSHILRGQMGHANINVTMKYYIAISDSGIEILKHNLNQME